MRTLSLLLVSMIIIGYLFSCGSGPDQKTITTVQKINTPVQKTDTQTQSHLVPVLPSAPDSVLTYPDTVYLKIPKDHIPAFSAIQNGDENAYSLNAWKENLALISPQIRKQLKKIPVKK